METSTTPTNPAEGRGVKRKQCLISLNGMVPAAKRRKLTASQVPYLELCYKTDLLFISKSPFPTKKPKSTLLYENLASQRPKERTFHLFIRLPAEIRIMIWSLMLPRPRFIESRCYHHNWCLTHMFTKRKGTCRRVQQYPVPVGLHVCKESRYGAFRAGYVLSSQFDISAEYRAPDRFTSTRMWINFSKDILFDKLNLICHQCPRYGLWRDRPNFQHRGFSFLQWHIRNKDINFLRTFLSRNRKLTTITIVTCGENVWLKPQDPNGTILLYDELHYDGDFQFHPRPGKNGTRLLFVDLWEVDRKGNRTLVRKCPARLFHIASRLKWRLQNFLAQNPRQKGTFPVIRFVSQNRAGKPFEDFNRVTIDLKIAKKVLEDEIYWCQQAASGGITSQKDADIEEKEDDDD